MEDDFDVQEQKNHGTIHRVQEFFCSSLQGATWMGEHEESFTINEKQDSMYQREQQVYFMCPPCSFQTHWSKALWTRCL